MPIGAPLTSYIVIGAIALITVAAIIVATVRAAVAPTPAKLLSRRGGVGRADSR
jgi:hypothetical protein